MAVSSNFCDIAIFWFFKIAAAAVLDLWNFKFLIMGTVKRVELHQCAKFRRNRVNQDVAIFRFFKMAAAAILAFWNFEFLTVGRVTSVELRHRARFRRNRSNRDRDMWVSILCELGLKMPIHAPFVGESWGTFPPNDVTHRLNPKKDRPWAEPRHLSHEAQISVARFKLGVGTRKKGQDRTGEDRKTSHKRIIFHLFVEKPPLKRCTWKFV